MMKMLLVASLLVAVLHAQTPAPTQSPLDMALDPNFQGCSDKNGDHIVDIEDLAALLVDWGVSNCWVPDPESLIYYVPIDSGCGIGVAIPGSTSTSVALAVIRFDKTQWGSWTSGSYAFSIGPDSITSVELRHESGTPTFTFFRPPSTIAGTKTWGFRLTDQVTMTDGIFDAIKANATQWQLYFRSDSAGSKDVCGVLGSSVPPPITGPPTLAPGQIPLPRAYSTVLSADGVGICERYNNPDSETRAGTATFTLQPVVLGGLLAGYTFSGSIETTGSAPNWWRQISKIRLVRVPGAVGMGPYTIAAGPQYYPTIDFQGLQLFVAAGNSLLSEPQLWRLDIVTVTSSASGFANQAEICGQLLGAAVGAPTAPPVIVAPTPFPPFAPRFLTIQLASNVCLPDGPGEGGVYGAAPRTATASFLLSRSSAGNFLTGSILFDVPASEPIKEWWKQVTQFDVYNRNDFSLFLPVFSGASVSNPFDSLSIPLTDTQLIELDSNTANYFFVGLSGSTREALVCGNLDPTAPTVAPVTLPPPPPPRTFSFELNRLCSGTGSFLVGRADLVVYSATATSLGQINGIITLTPADGASRVGFLGLYYSSSAANQLFAEDELLVTLFSAGYGQVIGNQLIFDVTVNSETVVAILENPSRFRVQLNTQTFNTGLGEICGYLPDQPAVTCEPCACRTGTPTLSPAPTAVPTPFVPMNQQYTLTMSGAAPECPIGSGAGGTGSSLFSLTYAPDALNPVQITLSGTFTISPGYLPQVQAVSLYRWTGGQAVMMVNLWSGAAGTLSSPKTFTTVVTNLFAPVFQEFYYEFFIGTSTTSSAVLPISICGFVQRVIVPTVAPPPTAPTAVTLVPTSIPTAAPTPPTTRPDFVQTDFKAVLSCRGNVNYLAFSMIQRVANAGGEGQITGTANPIKLPEDVVRVEITGGADAVPLLVGPLSGEFQTFNTGAIDVAVADGMRMNPQNYQVAIIYSTYTCTAPLEFF